MTPAAMLSDLFVVDHRVYGVQQDGGYVWRHDVNGGPLGILSDELTPEVLKFHLDGKIALGTVTQRDAAAKVLVWSQAPSDDSVDIQPLWAIRMMLAHELGWQTFLERGLGSDRLWLFVEGRADAGELASIGHWAIRETDIDVEGFYPVRRAPNGDYGQLIRLPFGVHQPSGRRYVFEHLEGPDALTQLAWLKRKGRQVRPAEIHEVAEKVGSKRRRKNIAPEPTDMWPVTGGLVAQIRSSLSILSFLQELFPKASWRSYGARYRVGFCPFHEAQRPSFWIDTRKRVCTCHVPECAAYQSMDVVDVWALHRGLTRREAVFELAEWLGVEWSPRQILESVPGLEIERHSHPHAGVTLQQARQAYENWLKGVYTGPSSRGRVYLVTLPAGAGKTTIALQVAKETDVRVHAAWALKQVRDEHADAGNLEGWATVDGRCGDDQTKDGKGNCDEYERALAVGELGYSVKESLCKRGCPVGISNCAYWDQWRTVGRQNVSVQHEHLGIKSVWDEADVLLIDEDFIGRACVDERTISRGMLEYAREGKQGCQYLRRLLLEGLDDVQVDIDTGAVDFDDISLATVDLWPYLEAAAGDAEVLTEVLQDAEAEICTSTGEQSLPVLSGAMERSPEEISRLGAPYMFHLVKALRCECERRQKHPERVNSQLSLTVDTSGRSRLAYKLVTRRTLSDLTAGVEEMPTVIILDAAGDKRYYETVLGCAVEEWTRQIKLPEDVDIYQVATALNGKKALENSDRARKAAVRKMDFSLALADGGPRPGLITHKGQRELFARNLGIESTQHFYNLRGSNLFANLDTLLVYGTPSPPPGQILRLARALHVEDEPIDPASEKIGGVYEFSDRRAQMLLEIWREREVYQAIYRIRPLERTSNGHGKQVVFFSPVDVPRLEPTYTITSLPRADTVTAFAGVARAFEELGPDASLKKLAEIAGCSWPTAKKYLGMVVPLLE